MNPIKLILLTPTGSWQFNGGDLVVITTKHGSEGFMRHHVPTIVEVVPGPVRYRVPSPDSEGETWHAMVVSVGYAEIQADQVTVVVNAAETPDQLDAERAAKALERAEKLYQNPSSTEIQRYHARHAMRRARARLAFYKKYVK